MADRPLRFCDVCGKVDDHPRHVFQDRPDSTEHRPPDELIDALVGKGEATAFAITRLMDGSLRERHLDCCAAQGCETCQATEEITGKARGPKLIEKVVTPGEVRDKVRAVGGGSDG